LPGFRKQSPQKSSNSFDKYNLSAVAFYFCFDHFLLRQKMSDCFPAAVRLRKTFAGLRVPSLCSGSLRAFALACGSVQLKMADDFKYSLSRRSLGEGGSPRPFFAAVRLRKTFAGLRVPSLCSGSLRAFALACGSVWLHLIDGFKSSLSGDIRLTRSIASIV
jgi:hypothetical protein